MKTAHRQAAKGKPRYADDFPDAEPAPEQDDDDSEPEQQEQEQ